MAQLFIKMKNTKRSSVSLLYFILFILCCQLFPCICNILSKDDEVKFMNFFHKPGLVLIESLLAVFNVTDVQLCQLECVFHESCLSINVGRKMNKTNFTCELNNSTSLAKPLKMRRRKGFDFYGPADPCFYNPCLNGGICISNMTDNYRCNCLSQIHPKVNFTNDHCAIESSVAKIAVSGVFHYTFFVRVYKGYALNYYNAKRACAMFGAELASLKQLEDGWRTGFDMCSYGWLIDGTIRFPIFIQRVLAGCGLEPPSIRGSNILQNKDNVKVNAYCFKEKDQCNEEDWYQNDKTCYKFYLNTKARRNEASHTCTQEGGTLGVFKTTGKLHFVKDFVHRRRSYAQQILVGLQQDVTSGAWKWDDGATVNSNLWNVTQPRGPIGTVNVQLTSLDNVPDTDQWKLPFVCQKNLP